MKEDAPSFNLRKLRFSLANVRGPSFFPYLSRSHRGMEKRARISAHRNVNPDPLRLKGNVMPCAESRLPISIPIFPRPERHIGGRALDTKLAVNLAQVKGNMTGSFRGGIDVRSFHTLDADNEDLLKWESLEIDKMAGTLAPFSLDIADIALSKFYSRIVVNKNGTLDLQQPRTPPEKVETPRQAPPASQSPYAPPAPPAPPATPAPPAAQG